MNPIQPPYDTRTQTILQQLQRYTAIAGQAVLQAQQEGVGLPGDTKAQMALKIVHTGLETAGLVVPGVAGAAQAEQALEPIFVPLFTSLVNLFRAHGHPAFTQPPAPVSSPAPASGQ